MSMTTQPALPEAQLLDVLRNSLYPGARSESVSMVLGYCKARGLDPMLKPVHIVPMYVRDPGGKGGKMQDVVMPGIGLYRIEAARTGQYAGKSEPRFGPDVTLELDGRRYKVPEHCSVTVRRVVHGHVCEFTATEYWAENYATAGRDTDAPNSMWAKRPRGQLAKCAEAQALRMAFPEATGQEVTDEEMEGKTFAPDPIPPARGPVVDAPQPSAPMANAPRVTEEPEGWPLLDPSGKLRTARPDQWLRWINAALAKMESADAVRAWRDAMAPNLAIVESNGGADDAAEARELIARRVDEFEMAGGV
jgi:phage recombination protein Bet